MKFLYSKGWLVFAFFGLLSSFGFAQTARANGATLLVNEVPVLAFRTAHGGFSPTERAALLARNLNAVGSIQDIKVIKSGVSFQVAVNDAPLITATPAESKALKSSPESVANMWASKLRQAVTMPPLLLGAKDLQLPNGETRTVKLTGSAISRAEVTVNPPDVVQARLVTGGVEVKAVGPGRSSVLVSAGDVFQTIEVDVRPYAAEFPQTVTAYVAGLPALSSTVQGAIEGALRQQLAGAPHARFVYAAPKGEQLAAGSSKAYTVKVEATAPGAYPRTGNVQLIVRNRVLSGERDTELWYDNDPESVKFPQPLFAARLNRDRPARMLYHHMNATTQPMFMRVQLVNDSDQEAKIAITPGDSMPDLNPVLAGIKAADMYVRHWMHWSAEILTVPARSTFPISLRRVAPNETMSGLCSLRLIEGPPDVLVRTDAYPPFPVAGPWIAALGSATPWREVGMQPMNDFDLGRHEISAHIYPDPQKPEQVWQYEVGGRHQFIRIGEKAIARQDNSGVLDGNFGVFYKIRAEISNPTEREASVDVQFIPSAGYSGALFIMNGELIRTPLLQPQSPWLVRQVKLQPGAKQVISLMTIPLSGSSYPVTLKIGATDRVAAAAMNLD